MKLLSPVRLAAVLALAASVPVAGETPAAAPFASGERLRYEVVWPSGLSLGEAEFSAHSTTGGWRFEAELTAGLPNLQIRESYRATADAELCSQELSKKFKRGPREGGETVEFDQRNNRALRVTDGGGGESELDVPPCARDALTFLYFVRQDLARGRIPPPDEINLGAQYFITVTYAESLRIQAAGESREADRILVDVSGPQARHSFEVFFGKDAARTPLLVKVPFDLGVFSLRLTE